MSFRLLAVVFRLNVRGIENVDEKFMCDFGFTRVMSKLGLGAVVMCKCLTYFMREGDLESAEGKLQVNQTE